MYFYSHFSETWILLFWVPVSSRIPTVNKGSAGGCYAGIEVQPASWKREAIDGWAWMGVEGAENSHHPNPNSR